MMKSFSRVAKPEESTTTNQLCSQAKINLLHTAAGTRWMPLVWRFKGWGFISFNSASYKYETKMCTCFHHKEVTNI
jgi:hypothetical protein